MNVTCHPRRSFGALMVLGGLFVGTGSPVLAQEQQVAKDTLPPPGVQGSPSPLVRNAEALTGKDLLDESFPGSLPLPGTGVRLKISGYAKLDFIHDLDNVGDRFEFLTATIPVEGTPAAALGGLTTLHAKESRLRFDLRSVARNEAHNWEFPLQVVLEFDFFDDRESFKMQPRLRLAYGVIGRLLAGQSWGITTDLSVLAGTIDFGAGDALYGGRAAQIRWEDKIGGSLKWAVGIEDPQTSIGNPDGL